MKQFDKVRMRVPSKNLFNLDHTRKFSMRMGYLTPIMVQEVLPSDKFSVNTEMMMRLAPMLAPVMHRVNVWVHYFFVPNRLVWSEWEDFITGGRLGTSAPVHPYIEDSNTYGRLGAVGGLADYMGLPVVDDSYSIDTYPLRWSALPFRAYQLIYDEYYRDQNLTASLDLDFSSGAVSAAEATKIMTIRKRCWEKDYFTSALPFAQRGPASLIPMEAAVEYKDTSLIKLTNGTTPMSTDDLYNIDGELYLDTPGGQSGRIENIESIENSTVTISDLRRSIRLQEWLEKNATAGARYTEQIRAHFGVISSDARLQRPEYLGGGKAPVVMSEVLSTVNATEVPQGNMAGHGIAIGNSNRFKRSFEEHGFIIGICSVLPETAYQQGLHKMYSRFDKFDYAWPEFAQIGEQEVKSRELYYSPTQTSDPEATFGYQSRYAEYKFMNSSVHGQMRSSLDYWHMGRKFPADFVGAPQLNTSFVESDPTTRIFAVEDPSSEHLYVQMYNRVRALRPLPYYGTPTL